MLHRAFQLEGPVAIRYPKGRARSVAAGHVGTGLWARLVREGADACILAVGKLVEPAEEAARLLDQQGVGTTVWDVRVAKPLDPDMLASAADHRLVVTAEDGVRHGGVGSAVETALAELARHSGRPGPTVVTLGVPDAYLPHGRVDALLSQLGLDGPGMAATVLSCLDAHRAEGRA